VKKIKNMDQVELAAFVQSHFQKDGIQLVLSGGGAVMFYSQNQYVSKDVDLINVDFIKRSRIRNAMESIGFHEKGRYYLNPETEFLVEFPNGPLSVGEEPVKEIIDVELSTGTLRVISSTDCVKDRLCAFFFWNDQQCLAQAVMVAENQKVDLIEIARWAFAEGKEQEYQIFKGKLTR